MRIAITGATGFLGHYIANRLLRAGHRCRCWYRPDSDRGGFADGDLEWVPGQLDDPEAVRPLLRGVDAVVHAALAWMGDGDAAQFVETNVVGSVRLMQAAKAAGAGRFVFISTCAVHDVILPDRKLDEAHPLWPKSHYGAHKAAIEKFVHSYGLGEGWNACSLRPTGIYGLARPAEGSRWFALIREVMAGRPIRSAAGGKEVHADDVAKAAELLLGPAGAGAAGQAYNCYDRYIAEQDVALIAARVAGSRSQIEMLNHGPRNQIDTSKLRALGMTFGGSELLERTIEELVEANRALQR